ncbi:potassium-transporting ATPase subunit KdpB [Streptomyces sp. 6N223]|uniref:potassium-transporting ATPase subunit KdpB n=1 Tax=Streptomyces sp. 6N223 TaxID=3457412 RepID=UPI003FD51BE5
MTTSTTPTPARTPEPPRPRPRPRRRREPAAKGRVAHGRFDPGLLVAALPDAVRKLHPRVMVKAPVMFVVEIGSVLTTVLALTDPGDWFGWTIAAWLWLTVLFANLAEAVAEGRGKAQADSLRRARTETVARRLTDGPGGAEERVPGQRLRVGDLVVCEAGDVIPGDGDVVEGVASVDESAITGESAPVIRESGGDRSAVTGGTRVLSDRIVVRVTARPGETFLDRMISLVEGAARQKTPNEIALNILLASLTIVFLLAVVSLQPFAAYAGAEQSLIVLTALLVCLIPTTIGALLSAIGIAGMDRLVQRNVLATSGRAVEAAGDVSTLLLDKTGTITFGNRQAAHLVPLGGTALPELIAVARLSSLSDTTPEGRSIVELCDRLAGAAGPAGGVADARDAVAEHIPFSAATRMSGADVGSAAGGPRVRRVHRVHRVHRVRKGAAGAVTAWIAERGGTVPEGTREAVDAIAAEGGTPLLVAAEDADGARVLGTVHLKDVVKPGMRERFEQLRRMGIKTVMITGDNAVTAKAIADEAGVDDVLAEATPEDKMALIKREQSGGRLVAMTGDGTNDAPALAQADVGVAMNTGTSAAKEAGNMVDLDSDPTKLIDIVQIGKQLLITRGALTTFSIANDVAKYFAIIPAMFAVAHPSLDRLNIMGLAGPESAILSAVVFNALIIAALVPLALRGVAYRPLGADRLLARNLGVFGLGGLVAPFVGIKLIDLLLTLIPGIG